MYRIVQVGVGGYGGSWLSTIMDSDRARHVALIDIDADNLERARQVTGVNQSACFFSLEEGISKVEADALLCVVPPDNHESWIISKLARLVGKTNRSHTRVGASNFNLRPSKG